MPRWLALALALAWLAPCPALAEVAADIARDTLESGHLQSGEADLTARIAADPKDNEARFGLGMVRFAQAKRWRTISTAAYFGSHGNPRM